MAEQPRGRAVKDLLPVRVAPRHRPGDLLSFPGVTVLYPDTWFAKQRVAGYVTRPLRPRREPALTEIFREIDEELRLEKLQRVWRRYGAFIIALVIGVVLGTAAYVAWKNYTESQRLERARAFAAAMDQAAQASDPAAAVSAFAALAEGDDAYAALARLHQAAAEQRAGNSAAAAAIYESLIADGALARQFRDLAMILLAMNTLDTADPDQLSARLAPLTAPDNPWRYSAQELTALLALRKGDTSRARDILTALAQDRGAPIGLQQRADELLAGIEG